MRINFLFIILVCGTLFSESGKANQELRRQQLITCAQNLARQGKLFRNAMNAVLDPNTIDDRIERLGLKNNPDLALAEELGAFKFEDTQDLVFVDVGFGTGRTSKSRQYKAAMIIYAYEHSRLLLPGLKIAAKEDPRILPKGSILLDHSVPLGSVDLVGEFFSARLDFAPSEQRRLTEIEYNLLKPGGRLVIEMRDPDVWNEPYQVIPFDNLGKKMRLYCPPLKELVDMLQATGFHGVHKTYVAIRTDNRKSEKRIVFVLQKPTQEQQDNSQESLGITPAP